MVPARRGAAAAIGAPGAPGHARRRGATMAPMLGPRGDDPTVAGGATTAATPELRGLIADRYEIASLVGVGGMGNVYRAVDRELGETVALKILRRAGGDDVALERFRDEVKLA